MSTPPDLLRIYQHQPRKYHELVSREDYQGNLLASIMDVAPLDGKRVVELGAGTGRVTCLLAPRVASITAFDASEAMLKVAEHNLSETGCRNWTLAVADHRSLPAPTAGADIAISGWSICCLAVYSGDAWEKELQAGLDEMKRVVRPGGMVIIIETLGTGFSEPTPPEVLEAYYDRLGRSGFHSKWVRTDYRFRNREEAADLTRFFFGESPVSAITEAGGGFILPECTGVWWSVVDTARNMS